jgi:hypothetical protein
VSPAVSARPPRASRQPASPALAHLTDETGAAYALRWLWYLSALFIPFAGLAIAFLLYDRDSRKIRKVGRNCLLIGFLFWVLLPALVLIVLAVAAVLGLLSLAADLIPPSD